MLNRKKITTLGLIIVLVVSFLISGCSQKSNNHQDDLNKDSTEEQAEISSNDNGAELSEANDDMSGVTNTDISSFFDIAENIAEKVKLHWPHMDKVWSGYDYTKHNLILFYSDELGSIKEAWLINSEGSRQLDAKEFEDITPPQPDGFAPLQFEDKPSIAMNLDDISLTQGDAAEQTYRTATHELVHFYYHVDGLTDAEGSRFQKFPIDKTPRLYRAMVYKNLREAFFAPDLAEDHLAKAKYWYEKWKSEFNDEYEDIKGTDIIEGTARYVENIGSFITDQTSDEDFVKGAAASIDYSAFFSTADAESYEIGYLSALLLDRNNPQWKESFYESGKTLEETLFENISEKEEEIDATLEKNATQEIETINSQTESDISELIKAQEDSTIPYLKINVTKSDGSFSAHSMLEYNNDLVITFFNNSYRVEQKDLNVNDIAVIDQAEQDNLFIIVPLTMEHKLQDGILTVDTKELEVPGLKVEESKDGERTIYNLEVEQ